jgi:hypothetical protein
MWKKEAADMRRILWSIFLAFGILFFNSPQAYACGQCADFLLDSYLPFLGPWLLLFWFWLMIRVVFWAIGKFTKQELPLTYSKRPALSLLIRIGLFIGILILTMASILAPSLLVIIPSWFFSLFLSQRKLYSVGNRGHLQNSFLYFQWAIFILIVGIFVNSMVTFNSPERLNALRNDPRNPRAAAERAVAERIAKQNQQNARQDQ